MRLARLRIRNFGCLRDENLEFAPGVNIIRGPNEAGKSTLQAAIIAALFHRPDTQDQSILGRASWAASEAQRLDMTLVAGEKTWTIEKDFVARKARLASGETVCEGAKAVQDALGEHLGLNSEELFTSTAFVRQDELAAIGEGREDIGELLQRRVTGGADDVAAQNVIGSLEDEIATMQRGVDRPAPKNPGPIRLAMTRLEEARAALAEGEEELQGLHGAQDDLAGATARAEELEEQLGVDRALLERMAARIEAQDAFDEADAALERLIQDAQRLEKEAADAEAAAAELGEIADKGPEALKEIDGLERTSERESGRAEQLQGNIERLEREEEAAPKPWPLVNGLTVAGVVVVVLSAVLGIVVMPWAFAGGAVGVALLAYGVAKSRVRPPVDYDARLGELRDELREADGSIESAGDGIASALAGLGCGSREELAGKLEQAREHANAAEATRRELGGKLGDETVESLEGKQREARYGREDAR